jgi:hypothetical protein
MDTQTVAIGVGLIVIVVLYLLKRRSRLNKEDD